MLDFLRQYKFSYSFFNFFKKKELEHNLEFYKKYGIDKKYYSSVSSEDFKHLEGEKNILDDKDAREVLPTIDTFNSLPEDVQQSLLGWSQNGYAILDGFFSEEEVDGFNAEVDRMIDVRSANWRYGNKIMFAIHTSRLLYDAGAGDKLKSILELLLGKEIDIFQSINFITGSQQRTHSDSIHMSTFPNGNMIAAWIALEDISMESGPLHYYPGSHQLPYVVNRDYGNVGTSLKLGNKTYSDYEDKIESIIQENKLEKKVFLAKKGDILIWHANLLHGGDPMLDENSTRKSMVFHYYAKEAVCYHEITQRPTLKKKMTAPKS